MTSEPFTQNLIFKLIPFLKKVGLWLNTKLFYQIFLLKNKKPPLDNQIAYQIATTVLGGFIVDAKSFKNINSDHIYIQVEHKSSMKDFDYRVYVLEAIGQTFRILWQSDVLYSAPKAEIVDLDEDGVHEIAYFERSFGTGGGLEALSIYSIASGNVSKISKNYNWQDRTSPIQPIIEIESKESAEFRSAMERFADRKDFLSAKLINLNLPEYAVKKWHQLNGDKKDGKIELHYYNGPPDNSSSVLSVLENDNLKWLAYFKGPIVCYLKKINQHFVAFSSKNMYDWPTSLAFDGKYLWFSLRHTVGIFRFNFEQQEGSLSYFKKIGNIDLPEIETLEIKEGFLTLNGSMKFLLTSISKNLHS
ncbi:MAG: hypothetical protein ACYDBV_11780 [Nitrospiria bacterium]